MLPAAKKTGDNSYEIEYEGLTYVVEKEDGKFFLGEEPFTLLRDLKEHIVTLDIPEDVEERFLLWDSISPAALLVKAIQEIGREPSEKEIYTLDEYGFIDDGKMNIEAADNEITRTIEIHERKEKNGN